MSIIGIGTKIVDLRRGIGSGSGGGGAAFSTKSLDFDGVDDYVATGNTFSDLDGGTTMTLSVWVKPITGNTFYMIAHNPRDIIAQNSQFLLFFYSGFLELSLSTRSQFVRADSSAINMDAWNHILCCVDLNNTTEAKIYINGVDETTSDNLSSFNAFEVASGIMRIAEEQTGYLTPFLGNIDEFSIWDTDQRANVAEIFNGGIPDDLNNLATVPAPNLWYRMGENSTFKTPQILMPENTNKDKVSNYSMNFDGLNDYVDCGTSLNTYLELGDSFSFSVWFKIDVGGTEQSLVDNIGGTYLGVQLRTTSANRVRFILLQANTHYKFKDSSVLNTATWYHVCITYDGSNTLAGINIYIDGDLDNSTSGYQNIMTTITSPESFTIGRGGYFSGKIDEVSIFNEVKAIGDLWNGTGQPTDLTEESGLVGYYRMGEEAVFNSTNWLLPNKAQDVFSRYSLDFDGVNDYISLSSVISLGVLSVSFWMKSSDTATGSITNGLGNINFIGTSPILRQSGNNYKYFADQVANFDGNWHHWFVLITGSGTSDISNARMFVDGVELAAGTIVTSGPPSAWTTADIGKGFYGYKAAILDEFAIWQSDETANVATIYNSGEPTDLTSLSPTAWYRMGEDATFSTNWTVPDQIGSNTGTSANMTNDDLSGDAPAVTGNGTSANMDIEDRTGDAPDSSNNSLSYNMDAADIVEETP